MTPCALVQHAGVVRGGFIMLHPAAVDKAQAPLGNQGTDGVLGGGGLLRPPPSKEGLRTMGDSIRQL